MPHRILNGNAKTNILTIYCLLEFVSTYFREPISFLLLLLKIYSPLKQYTQTIVFPLSPPPPCPTPVPLSSRFTSSLFPFKKEQDSKGQQPTPTKDDKIRQRRSAHIKAAQTNPI